MVRDVIYLFSDAYNVVSEKNLITDSLKEQKRENLNLHLQARFPNYPEVP